MVNRNNFWRWGVIILLLVLINSSAVLVYGAAIADPASASPELVPCGTQANPTPCNYKHFLQLIVNVFNYLTTYIAVPLAAGTIAVGGAIMMTAGTNDSKRSQAKKIIGMAVWGLVIVLASYLIVKVVFDYLVEYLVEPAFVPTNFRG